MSPTTSHNSVIRSQVTHSRPHNSRLIRNRPRHRPAANSQHTTHTTIHLSSVTVSSSLTFTRNRPIRTDARTTPSGPLGLLYSTKLLTNHDLTPITHIHHTQRRTMLHHSPTLANSLRGQQQLFLSHNHTRRVHVTRTSRTQPLNITRSPNFSYGHTRFTWVST